jgi:hypothetical protein
MKFINKNLILTIGLAIFLSFAQTAKTVEIKLHSPFSTTGNYSKIIQHLENGLKEKGWKLNIFTTGNLILSKDTYQKTTEPFILVWALETNVAKNDVQYLPTPSENELISIIHTTASYICTNKNISNKNFLEKEYTIGHDAEPNKKIFLDNFIDHIKIKHKLITYKNTAALDIALASGEVDFILTTNGAKLMQSNKASCIYNTSDKAVLGVPAIGNVHPQAKNTKLPIGMFWVAKNLNKSELAKLQRDIQDVKENYKPFLEFMDTMNFKIMSGTIPQQILFLKDLDNNLPNTR